MASECENKLTICYINSLPKPLLNYIFSFLAVTERLQLDNVCKYWKAVNVECRWLDVRFLKINSRNISVNSFVNMLSRCGANLISLEINDFASTSFPSEWLEIVAHSCPMLECLDFQISRLDKVNPHIPTETLNLLSERCRQLKQLNLKRRQFTDDGAKCFFKNCRLQAINFTFNQRLNGNCFRVISDDVQCIMLHGCWSLTTGLEYIRLCRNLRYLDISNCKALKSATVTIILQSVGASLIELWMGKNSQYTEAIWSIPSYCKKLKLLNLFSLSQVRNDLIEALSRHCVHLHTLSINKTGINDKSLFALRDMIFLQNLAVASTQITDVGLFAISQKGLLEKLVISYCRGVGDPGCIAVIRYCKNLKHFDVSNCNKVTDVTVNDAINVRQLNHTKLVVYALKTRIQNALNAETVEFHV